MISVLVIILIAIGISCLFSALATYLSKTTYIETVGIAKTICFPTNNINSSTINHCITKIYYYVDDVEYHHLTPLPFIDEQQLTLSYNSNDPKKIYLEGENVPNSIVGMTLLILFGLIFLAYAYFEHVSENNLITNKTK